MPPAKLEDTDDCSNVYARDSAGAYVPHLHGADERNTYCDADAHERASGFLVQELWRRDVYGDCLGSSGETADPRTIDRAQI